MSATLPTAVAALAAFAMITIGAPGDASAQIPEVSPGGDLANPAAPPPSPAPPGPAEPVIIPIGPDGQVIQGETTDESGFYFNDSGAGVASSGFGRGSSLYVGGAVPATHVVRRGDTLWDITWFYFNNPFNWPKVWAYNPEISNPHWIYPGDQVRLYPEGEGPKVVVAAPSGEGGVDNEGLIGSRPAGSATSFRIRQLAFVDKNDLKFAATIDGSTDEKLMLSLGDSIYLAYPSGKPPKVGKRYAIYKPRKSIKHPDSGNKVGAYVSVIGELEVVSVKKGKRARAVITDSTDVIERGAQVGPLQQQFVSIETAPNEVDATGTVVEQLVADELIGARQAVVIDLGKKQGLKVGNRLFVVRRGDAYEPLGGKVAQVGQDDRRFPARAIGEVVVVQIGENSSLGMVSLVIQEIGVGDRVLMRKSSARNAAPEPGDDDDDDDDDE